MCRTGRGRRDGGGAGRGHERGVGNARGGGPGRVVQRGASARRDRGLGATANHEAGGMNASDFQMMATMLKEQSGLMITPEKAYLVENRLQPVARRWGFANLDQLVGALRTRPDGKLRTDVVDAMTTNESRFFRE